jgi:hypothetical protein
MNETDIRYVHIRAYNDVWDIDTNDGPTVKPKGGVTVAYFWRRGMSFIELSTAVCSEHDYFDKLIGRNLARMDFFAGKTIRIPYTKDTKKRANPTQVIRKFFGNLPQ